MSEEKTPLINPADRRYHLGVESMDATHQEFMALVNRLGTADDAQFSALFRQLLVHTAAHFEAENRPNCSSIWWRTIWEHSTNWV